MRLRTYAGRVAVAASLLAVAGFASACSSGKDAASIIGGASASPTGPEKIATATNIKLGTILVDENGTTLYYFLKDKGTKSSCAGACANVWPPVTTLGAPSPGDGVQVSLLGVTKRADGSSQVTYGGHPLYYYVADKKAGDVLGQDVTSFGAQWYALDGAGKKIDKDQESDAATAAPSASPSGNDSSTHY